MSWPGPTLVGEKPFWCFGVIWWKEGSREGAKLMRPMDFNAGPLRESEREREGQERGRIDVGTAGYTIARGA